MIYYISIAFLTLFELLYFRFAEKFNIIDTPNHRSSHTDVTIRGGGIIIWIACLFYFFTNNLNYPYFIISISLLALISFLDDIKNVPKRIRFTLHIASLCLVLLEIYPFYYNPLLNIIIVIIGLGFLNGFNFMDGINGITVAYSLVSIVSFYYIETQLFHFVDSALLILIFISLLVFAFYNFRTKAKTFAGDVGSICIAFVFFFLQLLIYQKNHTILFLFLFLVYGIDIIFTIFLRLSKGENIFQAHRLHLFQLLKNEMGIHPLIVSSCYALIQLLFNIGIFLTWNKSLLYQVIYVSVSSLILVATYILVRQYIGSKLP